MKDALKSFVTAVNGYDPEMPEQIRPLSWLRTLLNECNAPEVRAVLERDDPDAMWMMLREVETLHDKLAGALAIVAKDVADEHEATTRG